MDKETLSNYGWIVIAVLVLVVMIALATPFGKFVSNAVQSTTQGLFDVNKNALGAVDITIANQTIDIDNAGAGNATPDEPEPVVAGATFSKYITNPDCHEYVWYHSDSCYTIEEKTLTWEELKDPANGNKYGYDASKISDTELANNTFINCECLTSIVIPEGTTIAGWAFEQCNNLKSVIVPEGATTIDDGAFWECDSLTNITIPDSVTTIGNSICLNHTKVNSLTHITFGGTIAQWNAINFGESWNYSCPEITVTCTDGTITIPAWRDPYA